MILEKHYCLKIWPGLQFSEKKKEYCFDEVPGLKEAGWS